MADVEGLPLLPETEQSPGVLGWLKDAARKLKREIVTLYIASTDTRISLAAKVRSAVVRDVSLSAPVLVRVF